MSDEQLHELPDVTPSFRARWDAWRMRRRIARARRPQRAAVAALAAVSRVPGVMTAGQRLAALCVLLGLAGGLFLALLTRTRPAVPT